MPDSDSDKVERVSAVGPALARYATEVVGRDLWRNEILSPRDRSLVTVAAMIQRGQQIELADQIGLALDNGVTAAEISETIVQLSFYSGWGNGTAAVAVAAPIFAARGISAERSVRAIGAWSP